MAHSAISRVWRASRSRHNHSGEAIGGAGEGGGNSGGAQAVGGGNEGDEEVWGGQLEGAVRAEEHPGDADHARQRQAAADDERADRSNEQAAPHRRRPFPASADTMQGDDLIIPRLSARQEVYPPRRQGGTTLPA